MNRLAEALKNTPFLVLDGALATELERAGMDLADPLWSARALMEAPEAILRVHRSYLEAGADIITSAGYQATIPGFMAKGCSREEAERLLRLAVRLVKRARDEYEAETGRRALAAASAGPYGAYLADGSEYSGHYDLSRRELADFHRERALILADEAPDLLAFETVPSLAEAEAIADAVSALPAGSAWLSFSCRDGETTCAGDRAEDCAAFLARAGAHRRSHRPLPRRGKAGHRLSQFGRDLERRDLRVGRRAVGLRGARSGVESGRRAHHRRVLPHIAGDRPRPRAGKGNNEAVKKEHLISKERGSFFTALF